MTRHPALSIAATVAAVALLGSGCASSPETSSSAPAGITGTVTVFAAASLTDAFQEIADEFTAANPGVDVVFNFGGSSGLAEQIVQGAPVDVFAAASPATMGVVDDAGLTDPPTNFATNTLEIAVPAGNPGGVTGLADLARPELAIALCAVEVPCGAASTKALDVAGVVASADTYEQDVRAVLTKVELGEIDAGLVYRTDVLAGDGVDGIEFPEAAGAIGVYPIAALSVSANADAAAAFVAFVLSPAGRRILEAAGFGVP